MHKNTSLPAPRRAGLVALFLAVASVATAQTTTFSGGTYLQNFNGLAGATWTNDSTLDGWSMSINGTTPTVLATSSGTASNFVNALSLGNTTDLALGFQPNTNNIHRVGLALTNSSGGAISSFDLGFTGEQWRAPGNDGALTLVFEFQVFASGTGSLTAATGWTAVTALNFVSPRTVTTTTPLDGNVTGNFTSVSNTSNAVSWAAGEDLWIRWSGSALNTPARRQMVGLDDVTFTANPTAIPEPSAFALFGGIAALGLVAFRRRRAASAA